MANSVQDRAIAKIDAEIGDYERARAIVLNVPANLTPEDYCDSQIRDLKRAKSLIVAAFADVTDPVTAAPKAKRGRKKKGLPASVTEAAGANSGSSAF